MFIFGHMGIGSKLASPWSGGLPKKWILVGTLFPDLLDKSLYYGMSLAFSRQGADLAQLTGIGGTRSVGHTAALLIAIGVIAVAKKSKVLGALSLGIATHLLLDMLGERGPLNPQSMQYALLFPLLGWKFPVSPFSSATQHMHSLIRPWILGSELIGAAILGWDYWKDAHEKEILWTLRLKRARQKLLKRR